MHIFVPCVRLLNFEYVPIPLCITMWVYSFIAAVWLGHAAFASTLPNGSVIKHGTISRTSSLDDIHSNIQALDPTIHPPPLRDQVWSKDHSLKDRPSLSIRADTQPASSPAYRAIPDPPQIELRRLDRIHSARFIPSMQPGRSYAFELTFPTAPPADRAIRPSIEFLRHVLRYAHKAILVGRVTADRGFVGKMYEQVSILCSIECVCSRVCCGNDGSCCRASRYRGSVRRALFPGLWSGI